MNEEDRIRCELGDLAAFFAIAGHSCRFSGLSYGKMGISVFLFHYAREVGDDFFRDTAMDLVADERNARLTNQRKQFFSLSYPFGLSGIGAGVEYLVQQGFLSKDMDSITDEIDTIIAERVVTQKLYLSTAELTGMKRYITTRMENLQAAKSDLLKQSMDDILSLLELHYRSPVSIEDVPEWKMLPDDPRNWGLAGRAGRGLTLLSALNPQHHTWEQLLQW